MRTVYATALLLAASLAGCARLEASQPVARVTGLCGAALSRAAALESEAERRAAVDEAIRTCSSFDEWMRESAAYPEALEGQDPEAVLAMRCADPTAGLGRYATCDSLDRALATPSPTLRPTRPPKPTRVPAGRSEPDARPTPADGLVPLPRDMSFEVHGATRIDWFEVSGSTWLALYTRTVKRASAICALDAFACVQYRPQVRPSLRVDPATGACTIDAVATSYTAVVYLPRWTRPSRVHRELIAWWRQVMKHAAWHEGRHIAILESYLTDARRMLVGRPCASASRIIARWARLLEVAQDAFDRRDRASLPAGPASRAD
jgi:predicted secreted Zn-dependent protease